MNTLTLNSCDSLVGARGEQVSVTVGDESPGDQPRPIVLVAVYYHGENHPTPSVPPALDCPVLFSFLRRLTFSHCALKLPCTFDSNVESYFKFLTLLPSLILWLRVARDDSDSRDWGVDQNRRLFPPYQTWRAPCSAAATHVHGRHPIPI